MFNLSGETVTVLGSTGFIGQAVVKYLKSIGAAVYCPTREAWDLLYPEPFDDNVFTMLDKSKYVINAAGVNGGTAFNKRWAADIFSVNIIMAMNMFAVLYYRKPERVISILSSCGYNHELCNEPLSEVNYLTGLPHPDAIGQGLAKRNLVYGSVLYNQQYQKNKFMTVVIPTMYGPGDNFDENRTKVVGGLISRFHKAKLNGDAQLAIGNPDVRREFMYIDDLPYYLVGTLLNYNNAFGIPLNICGTEQTIGQLAQLIAKAVKYPGEIVCNTNTKGQMRKKMDEKAFNHYFKYSIDTLFENGINKTVEYYNEKISSSSK